MTCFKCLLMSTWLILCVSCSADKAETPPSGVIPQAQLNALEKAKDLEGDLKHQEDVRRQQIEATGQ